MKCSNCGEEVMLAKICPYCNSKVHQNFKNNKDTSRASKRNAKGTFKGKIPKERRKKDRSILSPFALIKEYLMDPAVPFSKKLIIVGGTLYILSPLDLIPIFFFPLSLLDDILIGSYVLKTLSSELAKYRSGYYD